MLPGFTISQPPSPPMIHSIIITLPPSLFHPHFHPHTCTLTLPPSPFHPHSSTLTLPPSHLHPHTSTLTLPPSLFHPHPSTLTLAPSHLHPHTCTLTLPPSHTVVVEEGMTVNMVCHLLVVKNHFDESPNWVLVEQLGDVSLGNTLCV